MGDAGGGSRGQRNLEPDLDRGSDSGESEEESELTTVNSAQLARELGIDIRGISKMAAKGHSWSSTGIGDNGKGGERYRAASAVAGEDIANMAAKTNVDACAESVRRTDSGDGGVLPQFCVEETSYNEGQVKLKLKTMAERKSGKGKMKKGGVEDKKRKKVTDAKNKMKTKVSAICLIFVN